MPPLFRARPPISKVPPGRLRLRGRTLCMLEALALERGLSLEGALDDLLSAGLAIRRLRQAPPPSWRGLTRRERDVVRLLLQGFTDARIAQSLSIERQTVRTHVHHILRKYGACSRADLRRRVREEGGPFAF